MYKYTVVALAVVLGACAGTDYSKPCYKLSSSVAKVEDIDKKTAALAQSYLDACEGNEECVNAVVGAFLPIQVLIQNTFRFAESLQRGGVCSPETVTVVEDTVKRIEEIYNAYTK